MYILSIWYIHISKEKWKSSFKLEALLRKGKIYQTTFNFDILLGLSCLPCTISRMLARLCLSMGWGSHLASWSGRVSSCSIRFSVCNFRSRSLSHPQVFMMLRRIPKFQSCTTLIITDQVDPDHCLGIHLRCPLEISTSAANWMDFNSNDRRVTHPSNVNEAQLGLCS